MMYLYFYKQTCFRTSDYRYCYKKYYRVCTFVRFIGSRLLSGLATQYRYVTLAKNLYFFFLLVQGCSYLDL